ncbi:MULTISPECIES: hypothetical protein [Psychrilyobacter]|uniref:ECF transporter S component n=1 Tax=Psychrilyobacter piezotolerans TaxID=2293438 RepID=A0ABX9KGA9_9FUSO|nr:MULTISPECIES: hypothetical protein [Psychrilyobacter]MCS5420977.1 hypothetical protein [Psychrilyobacter sp. S5]NDI78778.1 hypothetical protein [Psychrilyobacter piezotolerans]RDE60879.1 hypothetical protein DV867_10205 [Psychrilyobacter sp. S5]REI40668.1 hypothetical protein DYH56_10205 [Psychrilyobacter piezotolerans]
MNVRNFEVSKGKGVTFALFMTFSLLAPYLFHLAGFNGTVFLPIFLGVILASQYLKSTGVMGIALLTPLANHILTGMPMRAPLPMLQLLTLEAAVLGMSAFYLRGKTSKTLLRTGIPLLLGRISSIILVFFYPGLSLDLWIKNFILGVPGMILNTALVLVVLRFFPVKE